MKPCVNCGRALENRATTCDSCGAEQLATESTAVVRDDLTTSVDEEGPVTPGEIFRSLARLFGLVLAIALGGYFGSRAAGTIGSVVGVVAALFVFDFGLWMLLSRMWGNR